MIKLDKVSMRYPLPRSYMELLLKPLQRKKLKTALEAVNLDIDKGDRVAFLGPNGAGKTTMLKLIGGLLYPSEGVITINGDDTTKQNLSTRATVGFVINEERSFYWRLTGHQNLRFFGELDNMTGPVLLQRIDELLEMVDLSDAAHEKVAGYSSGMKQKLAIARGLLSDPDILILDEPTRTLDPITTRDVRRIVNEKLHLEGNKTMLIATHNLEEATLMCNKVCLVSSGQIKVFERMETILEKHGSLDAFYTSLNT